MMSLQVRKMPLKTEDLGKMFEMAICLAYRIPYDGPYKYGMELPNRLKDRLVKLQELFPTPTHTAKKGARYDYTAVMEDKTMHLSAKTTKMNGGKVAPQVVGQAQPKHFCEVLSIPYEDVSPLKKYLQENIQTVLPKLVEYTFDCPTVYYHQEKDTIRYITLEKEIQWSNYRYEWTRSWEEWNNSATLKIQKEQDAPFVPILEVQFHTKSRTNMAVRWYYDNFLSFFQEHLSILSF